MKQLFLLALTGALGIFCASAQQTFNYDPQFSRTFSILLDEGEEMKIELTSPEQLNELPNPDSLIKLLSADIIKLGDSLDLDIDASHVYFIVGDSAERVVRVKRWPSPFRQFIIVNGEPNRFKDVQDTVVIDGWTGSPSKLYRYTFYLNFLASVDKYSNGKLNRELNTLRENMNTKWTDSKKHYFLQNNVHIWAPAPQGKPSNRMMMLIRPSIDIQNYQDKFIPSISLGLTIARNHKNVYTEYGISSEIHFRFAKDLDANSRTYINPFVTVYYGRGVSTESGFAPNRLFPYISLSFSPKNKGKVYREDQTFRFGVGRFFLGNKTTKIEPGIYVDGFFKSASPSLRLVQAF